MHIVQIMVNGERKQDSEIKHRIYDCIKFDCFENCVNNRKMPEALLMDMSHLPWIANTWFLMMGEEWKLLSRGSAFNIFEEPTRS